MANPHKGEVGFEADGKSYTLCFSANSLCDLEEMLGLGIIEIFTEMNAWQKNPNKIKLGFLRSVFCSALKEHDPNVTVEQAGKLIIPAGGILKVMELVLQSVNNAFPAAETKGTRPRKQSGIGKRS